jgi:hypothetical protein
MKTNELRLGNLVMYNNQIVKTTGLHYGMFECGSPNNNNWMCTGRISEVQPIELTEEVLLKIGFEKDRNNYNLVCGDIEVGYYIDKFKQVLYINVSREKRFYKNELRSYDVKYLHQLQSAYYLLTNEELEVNL